MSNFPTIDSALAEHGAGFTPPRTGEDVFMGPMSRSPLEAVTDSIPGLTGDRFLALLYGLTNHSLDYLSQYSLDGLRRAVSQLAGAMGQIEPLLPRAGKGDGHDDLRVSLSVQARKVWYFNGVPLQDYNLMASYPEMTNAQDEIRRILPKLGYVSGDPSVLHENLLLTDQYARDSAFVRSIHGMRRRALIPGFRDWAKSNALSIIRKKLLGNEQRERLLNRVPRFAGMMAEAYLAIAEASGFTEFHGKIRDLGVPGYVSELNPPEGVSIGDATKDSVISMFTKIMRERQLMSDNEVIV